MLNLRGGSSLWEGVRSGRVGGEEEEEEGVVVVALVGRWNLAARHISSKVAIITSLYIRRIPQPVLCEGKRNERPSRP